MRIIEEAKMTPKNATSDQNCSKIVMTKISHMQKFDGTKILII